MPPLFVSPVMVLAIGLSLFFCVVCHIWFLKTESKLGLILQPIPKLESKFLFLKNWTQKQIPS
jgi:hypothetical protein